MQDHVDEQGGFNVRQCPQKHRMIEDISEDDVGSSNHNYSLDFDTCSRSNETRGEVSSHCPANELMCNPPIQGEKHKESKSRTKSEKFTMEHNFPLADNAVDEPGDITFRQCSQKHLMFEDGSEDDVGSTNHNYSLDFDTVSKNKEKIGEVSSHDPVNELILHPSMKGEKEKEIKSSPINEKFTTEHNSPLNDNPVEERGDINVCSQKHRIIEDGSEDNIGSTKRKYSRDFDTVTKNKEARGEVSSHYPVNELMLNSTMHCEKKECQSISINEKFISERHSPLTANPLDERGDINVCSQKHRMIDDRSENDVGSTNHNYSLDSNTVSKNDETRGEVSSHDSVKDMVCTPLMNGKNCKESKSSIMIEEFITVDTKYHSPLAANDVEKWGDVSVCSQKHRMIEDMSEDDVGSTNHNNSLDFDTFSRINETRGDISSHDPGKDLMSNPSIQSEEEKESKSSTAIEEFITADTKHNSLEVVNDVDERGDINVRQFSQKHQMVEDVSEDDIGGSNHNYSLDFDTVSKSNETQGEVSSYDPLKDLVCTRVIKDEDDKESKSSTINEKFINVDTKYNSQLVVNNDVPLSKESECMQDTAALLRSNAFSTPVNLFDSKSTDGHSDSSVDYEDDFQ